MSGLGLDHRWLLSLWPKMKAGGRQFSFFSKGGAQKHSVCMQGHQGSSQGCSASLICQVWENCWIHLTQRSASTKMSHREPEAMMITGF